MQTTPHPRAAFTLVELLTVVAIIAVLAAILLPALKSAQDRAKAAQCTNNQREIAAGFSGYLSDNNAVYPYVWPRTWPTGGWGAGRTWNYQIAPYAAGSLGTLTDMTGFYSRGYRQLLQCPATLWPFPKNPSDPYTSGGLVGSTCWAPTSYAMNETMFPQDFVSDSSAGTNSSYGWSKRVRSSDIREPTTVMLIGESPFCMNNKNFFNRPLPADSRLALQWCVFQTGSGGCGTTWVFGGSTNLLYSDYSAFFHNAGMNTLFVDGHVERKTRAALFAMSSDFQTSNPSGAGNGSAGAKFWNDNRGLNYYWCSGQFPGAPYPTD